MVQVLFPPTRPVLLILDGHGSHISIELIELAKSSDVHLLCLPAHCTHILQPLDVGVFKSLKTSFSKACTDYMASNPGCVITSEKLSSLLANSWPQSVTVLNIMAGFKKTGIHPFNPSEISDRQIAPSTVFQDPPPPPPPTTTDVDSSLNGDAAQPLFSPEKELLFQLRYEENYNVGDPEYIAWLRINHPEFNVSGSFSETSSSHSSSTGQALSDILVLPKAPLKQKRKAERRH